MTSNQSPSGSSEEGEYEDDAAMPEPQWQSPQQNSTEISNPTADGAPSSAQPARSAVPMQKRRRVTRACDECRRKKIKCDGKQPCTHCTVYSYECTYDQPSNRRRNPAPQYVEALENRLRRAEDLLRTVLPDVDLGDPNLTLGASQRMHSAIKDEPQPPVQQRPWVPLEKSQQGNEGDKDSMLESMVANTGSLDLDDEGHWDFHGHSSGRVFLRRMREQFGALVGKENPANMPFKNYKTMKPLDSPKVPAESPIDRNLPIMHELPDKHCAQLLCKNALDDAGAMLRLVHRPTFLSMFDRVYDIPVEGFGDEENRFVPLLYAVIALGTLFAKAEESQLQRNGYDSAIDQGYRWFSIARQLVDLTDCRDLTSLQTIIYMILFLQSSARLSTCYSYIGIALRSAIRMGLHRSVSNSFNPIERELRKRMFWIIRKLDIYVGALLGLPQMLSNDDIDQEMPIEVDDEYITADGILPMPTGKLSVFAAFNAHTRLVEILVKTVRYIYPIKESNPLRSKGSQSYVVSHSKIREIEQDLQSWMEALPVPFRPGEETSPEFTRIRHILRMAYAHIQMFLYRPFLHYASQSIQAKMVDKRSYACAAACVSVSRNIIHLTSEMKKRGLLMGSYWFYMYTTFFAIIALLFYVLENPHSPSVEDLLRDAYEGKDTLASLADRSLAADRCSRTLDDLFEQIPDKLQDIRNTASHKRRQPSAQLPIPQTRTFQSAPEVTARATSNTSVNPIRRASTSPINQDAWRGMPPQRESSALRHHVVGMDSPYQRSPQDPYSTSNSNSAEMQTANSPNSSLPSTSSQGPYGMQPFSGQAVPDLSAMMFPSADPFAYPNQPMTTLENRHFIKQEATMDPSIYNLAPTTSSSYDNLSPQMFGAMPAYTLQGQQPNFGLQDMNLQMSMSNADPATTTMSMQNNDASGWPRGSVCTPGVNLDQLFGEDWGGWMNQGYRQ